MVNLDGRAVLPGQEESPAVQPIVRQERRTAPRWFSRKLREIDRHLSVRWSPHMKSWEIGEMCPWSYSHGGGFYEIRQRWQRVIFADALGTRVLEYVRRVRVNQFKNVKDMVEKLNVDYDVEKSRD